MMLRYYVRHNQSVMSVLGTEFKITSATLTDMFPLTNHCKMVMTFDRLSDDEMN
jgi:hypothetical protein